MGSEQRCVEGFNMGQTQWRSEGPAGPTTAGPARPKGPARGPPERSSRRNLLARPKQVVCGGPENRHYATGQTCNLLAWKKQRYSSCAVNV